MAYEKKMEAPASAGNLLEFGGSKMDEPKGGFKGCIVDESKLEGLNLFIKDLVIERARMEFKRQIMSKLRSNPFTTKEECEQVESALTDYDEKVA